MSRQKFPVMIKYVRWSVRAIWLGFSVYAPDSFDIDPLPEVSFIYHRGFDELSSQTIPPSGGALGMKITNVKSTSAAMPGIVYE